MTSKVRFKSNPHYRQLYASSLAKTVVNHIKKL